jgi:hypothetical protein
MGYRRDNRPDIVANPDLDSNNIRPLREFADSILDAGQLLEGTGASWQAGKLASWAHDSGLSLQCTDCCYCT